jgi:hypothetical protein
MDPLSASCHKNFNGFRKFVNSGTGLWLSHDSGYTDNSRPRPRHQSSGLVTMTASALSFAFQQTGCKGWNMLIDLPIGNIPVDRAWLSDAGRN